MNFFKKIWKSVYGPELYQDPKNTAPGVAIKYYLLLAVLVSIIWGVYIGSGLVVSVKSILTNESVANFVSVYPAELDLKISNGEFSTNVKEPYFIPIPKNWQSAQKGTSSAPKIENIAVIDTSVDKISPDILTENKTALFITKNSIISDKNGVLQITNISNQKGFQYDLTRENIQGVINKFLPAVKSLVYLIPIFVIIGEYAVYALGLLPLFLLALVVWLVMVIRKQGRGYMQAYGVTLYAVTLVYILQILILGNINWFWTTVIIVVVIVVNTLKGNSAVVEPSVEIKDQVVNSSDTPELK